MNFFGRGGVQRSGAYLLARWTNPSLRSRHAPGLHGDGSIKSFNPRLQNSKIRNAYAVTPEPKLLDASDAFSKVHSCRQTSISSCSYTPTLTTITATSTTSTSAPSPAPALAPTLRITPPTTTTTPTPTPTPTPTASTTATTTTSTTTTTTIIDFC